MLLLQIKYLDVYGHVVILCNVIIMLKTVKEVIDFIFHRRVGTS